MSLGLSSCGILPSEEDRSERSRIATQQSDSFDKHLIKHLDSRVISDDHGICSICLENIPLQETALVKGCEHAYCVTCILIWATYDRNPSCPQCKNPFRFLNVHRTLDGSICDYMFEESVCLLLRATWFVPLHVVEVNEEQEAVYANDFDDMDEDDIDVSYYGGRSPGIHIGNRRWGNSGYVRAGRREARPVDRQDPGAGSSHGERNKEASKGAMGRRAKRAMKRDAADKAAAAKHQQEPAEVGQQVSL